MKIAIVHDSLIRAGAERQALYAVRELNRLGCEAELIHYNQVPKSYDAWAEFGVRPTFLPKRGRPIRFLATLTRYFRRRRFDVVHGFMDAPTIYAALAARHARIPTIFGGVRVEYCCRGMVRFLHRRLDKCLNGWIVNSAASGRALSAAIGTSSDRVFVVYNGIDPETFGRKSTAFDTRSTFGNDRNLKIITTIGRLEAQKNHALLLEAAQRVVSSDRQARFLIVGEGSLRSQLMAEIERRGLRRVVSLLGSRDDIPAILAATDVFVMTSNYEGLSNVVLEALASAVPVVTTACAGIEEIIDDGENGLVVPLHDAAAVADRINLLLGNERLRKQIGCAGQSSVRSRFSLEAMGRRLMEIYSGQEAIAEETKGNTQA